MEAVISLEMLVPACRSIPCNTAEGYSVGGLKWSQYQVGSVGSNNIKSGVCEFGPILTRTRVVVPALCSSTTLENVRDRKRGGGGVARERGN
jgi:hypothetical protein